ncbi:hypothetical protein HZS_903 [Henneguya salminicola]|nr:hypothetical protein HZS_903 [Henneguya salminicola]
MAETNKIENFFSKLDKNKKKSGFITVNEVTEKKQQRLEAQLKRQNQKKLNDSISKEDDEWKPIESTLFSSSIVPFEVQEESQSEPEIEEEQETKPEPAEIHFPIEQMSVWTAQPTITIPEPVAPPVETPKITKFVPGARRILPKAKAEINIDEEFPELISTGPKKKNKKNRQAKNLPKINGSKSIS